jgi:hypothetical protein
MLTGEAFSCACQDMCYTEESSYTFLFNIDISIVWYVTFTCILNPKYTSAS